MRSGRAPLAVAVSPHLDDAAFSAGATLAWLAARGWRVRVVTAFTATMPDPQGFALACQLDKGLGPEVDYMSVRRGEDLAACAALGAEAVHLPLPEAPHRGYGSAPALFADVRDHDAVDEALAGLLGPLLAGADLLLACQAVGGHVDHRLTVRAIDRLGDARPPALWWRDFPYSIRPGTPPEPLAARFAELATVAVEGEREVRLAACAAYGSQLGFQFGGRGGLQAALAHVEVERFAAEPGAADALGLR